MTRRVVCETDENPAYAGKWCTCYCLEDPAHVYVHPLRDTVEHTLDPDGDCVCGPRVELVQDPDGDDAWILTHHSLDGRERNE